MSCPALPSGQAADDLVNGRPGGLGRTILCTAGRAALIGTGMWIGGKKENVGRDAVAGALAIEVFVLAWGVPLAILAHSAHNIGAKVGSSMALRRQRVG